MTVSRRFTDVAKIIPTRQTKYRPTVKLLKFTDDLTDAGKIILTKSARIGACAPTGILLPAHLAKMWKHFQICKASMCLSTCEYVFIGTTIRLHIFVYRRLCFNDLLPTSAFCAGEMLVWVKSYGKRNNILVLPTMRFCARGEHVILMTPK